MLSGINQLIESLPPKAVSAKFPLLPEGDDLSASVLVRFILDWGFPRQKTSSGYHYQNTIDQQDGHPRASAVKT